MQKLEVKLPKRIVWYSQIKASTLIYDKQTNQLIGACLVSMWEGWPNVFDFGTPPSISGERASLNDAEMLHKHCPVTRLFVTLGTEAEYVYHKLGFMPGAETTEMRILAK